MYVLINRFTVLGVMLVNQRIQQFKFITNQQILQTTCTTNFSDIDMQAFDASDAVILSI